MEGTSKTIYTLAFHLCTIHPPIGRSASRIVPFMISKTKESCRAQGPCKICSPAHKVMRFDKKDEIFATANFSIFRSYLEIIIRILYRMAYY